MAEEYTVTKVQERQRLTDQGQLEKVYRVEAKTRGGTPFSVDLSEEEAEPKKAAAVLAAKARKLDGVLGL